jgi:pimeloyl-ACP methyl ester carboxylesterase
VGRKVRLVRVLGVGLLLAVFGVVFALWFFQEALIYPARRYRAEELEHLPPGLLALRDPVDSSSIVGFYRPPRAGGVPRKLWLAFGGNGDQALYWDAVVAPSVTPDVGFLLVEYPGYGARAGKPSPESLLAGTETTVQALAAQLGTGAATLQARTSLLGFSLGGAAALQYAARHPAQRIILFAPFTSMLDMARRVVGTPLCYLLAHRYDNLAALRTIRAHGQPPITILHGAQDSLIPHTMGEALATAAPGSHFELVPGANHGDVIDVAAPRLRDLLAEP